jgi:hypothetical protein
LTVNELIDSIVNEVLKRIESLNKTALVIFTGGNMGLEEVLKQLNRLIEDKWNLKVFLTKSAERVITSQYVKERLNLSHLYPESLVDNEKALLKDVKHIIIPTLTMNSAAKIALGIADTMATNIIAGAIMKGLTVTAAIDACDPKNTERLAKGYNKIPPAYEKRISAYLYDLQGYGVKLAESGNLYHAVSSKSLENRPEDIFIPKKIITSEDVINVKNNGTNKMCITQGTIVTLLAKDTARELGVDIECILQK